MQGLRVKEHILEERATMGNNVNRRIYQNDPQMPGFIYKQVADDLTNIFEAFRNTMSAISTNPELKKRAQELRVRLPNISNQQTFD